LVLENSVSQVFDFDQPGRVGALNRTGEAPWCPLERDAAVPEKGGTMDQERTPRALAAPLLRSAAALVAVGALTLSACGGESGSETTTARTSTGPTASEQVRLMADGARVFTQHCHACHTLFGEPPPVPPFEAGAPSFDEVEPSVPEIRDRLGRGGRGMPSFRMELDEQEQRAVTFYLTQVAGDGVEHPEPGELDPATLERGERVFRASCEQCHQIAGRQATGEARDLGTSFDAVRPSEWLVRRRVHNGINSWMPSFVGRLSAAEIRAVARYVNATARR
jgi:mono/diheme cytochrome c family protein